MRVVALAVIAAFLAGPAFAQQKAVPRYGEEDKTKSTQEKQDERDAEKAYRRSLGNIPEQKALDPWGNVRTDNAAKPDAKSSSKKAKTGTSAN